MSLYAVAVKRRRHFVSIKVSKLQHMKVLYNPSMRGLLALMVLSGAMLLAGCSSSAAKGNPAATLELPGQLDANKRLQKLEADPNIPPFMKQKKEKILQDQVDTAKGGNR